MTLSFFFSFSNRFLRKCVPNFCLHMHCQFVLQNVKKCFELTYFGCKNVLIFTWNTVVCILVSILGKFASVSMNLCKKDKCTKVPVETTQYVEQKQCLPFELDLAHMSAHHGDPCASYDQGVINAQVFFLSTSLFQTLLLSVWILFLQSPKKLPKLRYFDWKWMRNSTLGVFDKYLCFKNDFSMRDTCILEK